MDAGVLNLGLILNPVHSDIWIKILSDENYSTIGARA